MGDFKKVHDGLTKLGATKPYLRQHIRPLLAALKTAFRYDNDPYAVEGIDFAAKIYHYRGGASIEVFHPIANAGRRGKIVEKDTFSWQWSSSTAWDAEAFEALKIANGATSAIFELGAMQEEITKNDAYATVRNSEDRERGVDVEIPKSMHIKNINGVDVHVNLNSNPITVSSDSLDERLEMGHMTYWWKINPLYKKQLMAIAPLLEKARDDKAAKDILSDAGIRSDFHMHMQSGWD